MTGAALWTHALSRNFGDTHALENITLTLPYGQIGAILGPNGSGKSTLMRVLVGLLRPTHGELSVLNLAPFEQAERLRASVGVLLEPRPDAGNLSVLESLQSAGEESPTLNSTIRTPQTARSRAARIDEMLYRFDLWPQRHRRVADLGAGACAKLALVATLVPRPTLLLLDEPGAALDLDHRLNTLAILRAIIQTERMTALFTTHTPADAEAIADIILVLVQGRIVAQGSRDTLLDGATLPILEITGRGFTDQVIALIQRRSEVEIVERLPDRLIIHLNRPTDTAPLVSLLVESSADIDEVHKHQGDLQTRYRQLLARGDNATAPASAATPTEPETEPAPPDIPSQNPADAAPMPPLPLAPST